MGAASMAAAGSLLPAPLFCPSPCEGADCRWEWQAPDPTTLQYSVTIPGFEVSTNAHGVVISLRGQGEGVAGEPDLGRLVAVIPGRVGWHAGVYPDPIAWQNVSGVTVAPVAGRYPVEFGASGTVYAETRLMSELIYRRDEFWPASCTTVMEAWAGTSKLVRVECAPLQYNPVAGVLRYTARSTGRIVFSPTANGRR